MSKKVRNITRKLVVSRDYNVYEFKNGESTLLGSETISGRPSEKQVAEKYGVSQVVLECTKENVEEYYLTVDEFMKYAHKKEEIKEEKNN